MKIIFSNFTHTQRFIDNIYLNSDLYCEKQQLLQYNDEVQQQCYVMQSPIAPNKFQFRDFIYQMNLKDLIISKYFGFSNLGYLRDEWLIISVLLFAFLPICIFLVSNKFLTPYLLQSKKIKDKHQRQHQLLYQFTHFVNPQYISENNLNQLYHGIIRGFIGLYFTISCFLNMINKSYQENLNFIVISFLIFKLTDITLLSLYKSNDKLLYIRHIISFFCLYFSIYLDKEGLKYIYLLIFDEFLHVINITYDLFQVLKFNSNYKFFVSTMGLCFISMTVLPKQLWIIYDSTLINPFNLSTLLVTLSLVIVIILELLYSIKFIKEIVKSYSKISF
ncbi:hypothetical protein DICPUDRAFT_80577 [Dictyostelium purpureum]|uniref:Transmembrane protein n=1 Tax=Dictyostelium purpureum TaxID=5786 RepID=F0ZQW9_DICPU|nr:uncharacterized protein DICPUDRAFT_80577 [Dictyostelium purpureum]EGC33652.1 hypothetical protein DICPUDRAFT_80577 [Dictyostelium purpureum]|eukprot:XP_003289822.1 hypothetical protein DICPUDRAFT_80577 [Dictyostelium purpureum]